MSARDEILAKVRASLGVKGQDASRSAAVEARLGAHARHPIPSRVAGKPPAALRELLITHLRALGASVVEVARPDEVPGAISRYLRDKNLAPRVRLGEDRLIAQMPWSTEPALETSRGPARPDDEVGVTRALSAVAETGTLLMASGPDNPVTLSFMPETHVVVVEAADVVGPYEDAWQTLRERFPDGAMPRTVNLITGPSRTGDIGGRIVMGAHGPRQMCVILIGEDAAGGAG